MDVFGRFRSSGKCHRRAFVRSSRIATHGQGQTASRRRSKSRVRLIGLREWKRYWSLRLVPSDASRDCSTAW
jgi:hypothetical protein